MPRKRAERRIDSEDLGAVGSHLILLAVEEKQCRTCGVTRGDEHTDYCRRYQEKMINDLYFRLFGGALSHAQLAGVFDDLRRRGLLR